MRSSSNLASLAAVVLFSSAFGAGSRRSRFFALASCKKEHGELPTNQAWRRLTGFEAPWAEGKE